MLAGAVSLLLPSSDAPGQLRAEPRAAGKSPAGLRPAATRQGKVSPRKSRRRGRRARVRGQQAPQPERIREIQRALAEKGHYRGQPSGRWDAETTAALKAFQQGQRRRPTGRLDAVSLQRLGLGSEVAGVAAPRPAGTSPTAQD